MGLLIYTDDNTQIYSGPYHCFSDFRQEVAKALGLSSYQSRQEILQYAINFHHVIPFFFHSDCDGEWSPDDCRSVYLVLERALDKLPSYNECEGPKWTATNMMDGLKHCYENQLTAHFG